jgi:hypothetical protein
MSTEQVIMESQNLNSITFIESESMPADVTNRSNGRRIGFLRRKIVELQDELDALLALEPVKVSKNVKGRPKSVKKLSPQQEADDDLFANLVDEMWSETTPDVKKFKAPVEVEEELVVEELVAVKVVAKKEKKHVLTEEEKEAKKAALVEEKKLKKEADKALAAEEKRLKKEAEKAAKKSESAKKAAATRAANKMALKAAATANDSDNESTNNEVVSEAESAPVLSKAESEVVAPVLSEAKSEVKSKVVTKKAPVVSEAPVSKESKAVAEVVVEVKPTKVTVSRITIGDIKYLKSNTNVLYNPDTKEEVGMYDAETNSVKPLPDNEDDEMSEDEYESEEE